METDLRYEIPRETLGISVDEYRTRIENFTTPGSELYRWLLGTFKIQKEIAEKENGEKL